MASDIEKSLIDKLKSNNSAEVYSTLTKIKKFYVRNQFKIKKLLKYSIMEIIIPFLEHPKFCSISLSIIVDGCLELSFVREVIKHNGIQSLMRIMKNFVNDDIQNTACRALANMAKFDVGYKAVHAMKPVTEIINFLAETNDINCQQTAVRMLMILGRNRKTKDLIVRENGLIHIVKLLRSTNVNLIICSIKAVAKLTRNCSMFFVLELIKLKFHEVILELISYSEKSIQRHAMISLKNLSKHQVVRYDLLQIGALKLFTDILSQLDSHEMSRLAALALCNCLDYVKAWRHFGTERAVGLKALLVVLQNKKFEDIHMHVIFSLIPLACESKIADILLKLGVLQILIEILNIFIEKYKCKLNSPIKSNFKYESDDLLLNSIRYEDSDAYSSVRMDNHLSKENNRNPFGWSSSESTILKSSVLHEKFDNFYPSDICNRWDNSFCGISPTSDYASCSPARKSPSPVRSPETPDDHKVFCEIELPSYGHVKRVLYPIPLVREMIPQVNGWSPVVSYVNSFVSSRSNSPAPEYGTLYNLGFEELSQFPPSSANDNFHLLSSDDNLVGIDTLPALPISNIENENLTHNFQSESDMYFLSTAEVLDSKLKTEKDEYSESLANDNFHLLSSDGNLVGIDILPALPISNIENENLTHNFQSERDVHLSTDITAVLDSKLKTEKDEYSESCNQSLVDTNIKSNKVKPSDFDTSNFSEEIQSLNSVQCNEISEKHTIDHYVLLLIFQLSFHLEKKLNSQVVDKTCFSVLVDYLCFIHNPSPKAEIILLNLIKNRYCLEKLVVSGFISEMEDKMLSSNYACIHRSDVKQIYFKILDIARQEVESNFGIRTLSHILTTSDKIGQLYALSTISKLITDKPALHTLLFQANGLSLLCNFLSESSITVRRKAIISLCELYQSLTKGDKKENCCFRGTCEMKTSVKCYYKISYHDVSFIVSNGIIILANWEKLCENSEYFSALLNGHFLESSVKTVSLPEISAENLSTIFHFLHGCGTGSGYCCPYITRIPFVVLLELLCYCDKFLLNNIRANVEDRLCHYLNPSTVTEIYRESKVHNSPALSKRSLKFALTMNTVQREILWSRFEELINLDSSLDFYGDIESLFKSAF